MIHKIISGGQTGADRGGLEAAAELGLARGGWAPKGWRAEDGEIPAACREGMSETKSHTYWDRTARNIGSGDATILLSFGDLPRDSGSMLTAMLARGMQKPCRHFLLPEGGELSAFACGQVRSWLRDSDPGVLNVAGPRESREPGIQLAVRRALVLVLGPR